MQYSYSEKRFRRSHVFKKKIPELKFNRKSHRLLSPVFPRHSIVVRERWDRLRYPLISPTRSSIRRSHGVVISSRHALFALHGLLWRKPSNRVLEAGEISSFAWFQQPALWPRQGIPRLLTMYFSYSWKNTLKWRGFKFMEAHGLVLSVLCELRNVEPCIRVRQA